MGRMRIKRVITTEEFLLFMIFDNGECRRLNMKEFIQKERGLLEDICNSLELFKTARVDGIAGTVVWRNGVDFDPAVLYSESQKVEICDVELKGD